MPGMILDEQQLTQKAAEIRRDILKMLVNAGSGHTAGSLGMADVFAVLYFTDVLTHDPQNPNWENRDRVVLSNGHICPALYATLAHAGYFPQDKLLTLRRLGSPLQGHPHREQLRGVEISSGPLGCGVSQAAGMAYVAKTELTNWRVICLLSDGEHQEGNTWEGAMFAGKHHLSTLTSIIDRNNIQIDGFTEKVMPLEPLKEKYESFNWQVLTIDGHNHEDIYDALKQAKNTQEKPTAIIANTTPGKGVEFIENLPEWHGKAPSIPETVEALNELRTLSGTIASGHG